VSDARVGHRLAVLMTAEVVGYSLLTGIDEQGSLAALGAVRRDMIDPKVDQHKAASCPGWGRGPRERRGRLAAGRKSPTSAPA
jgi:adenylate cyclase